MLPVNVKGKPNVHELSVALSILDEVCEAALEERVESVQTVRVRVGALSGISPDALRFAWELAAADTVAAGSELRVDVVPLVVSCERCGVETHPPAGGGFVCGVCGAVAPTIVQGRGLELVGVEVPA